MVGNFFDDDYNVDVFNANSLLNDFSSTNQNLQQTSETFVSVEQSVKDDVFVNRQNLVLVCKLGQGAYADVYLYRDKVTNIQFAVKVMKNDPKNVFINQHRLMRNVNHKGLNKVYAQLMIPVDNKVWIVNQYDPDFHSLKEELINRAPLIDDEIIIYSKQLLEVIDYLHRNYFMHRDIKPENVLVNTIDKEIRLIDFDTMIRVSWGNLYANGCVGTPGYMSPEMLEGNDYTSKTDIYSFGGLLLDMLGYPPSSSLNHSLKHLKVCKADVREGPIYPHYINSLIKDVLDKCLEFDPDKRSSAQELLEHPLYNFARRVACDCNM